MRFLSTLLITLALSTSALAQSNNPLAALQNISPEQQQAIMQQMQQATGQFMDCYNQVGHDAMMQFQQETMTMLKGIRSLCESGARDKAEMAATAYATKMSQSPINKQLGKCASSMMQDNPFMQQMAGMASGATNAQPQQHICDATANLNTEQLDSSTHQMNNYMRDLNTYTKGLQ